MIIIVIIAIIIIIIIIIAFIINKYYRYFFSICAENTFSAIRQQIQFPGSKKEESSGSTEWERTVPANPWEPGANSPPEQTGPSNRGLGTRETTRLSQVFFVRACENYFGCTNTF